MGCSSEDDPLSHCQELLTKMLYDIGLRDPSEPTSRTCKIVVLCATEGITEVKKRETKSRLVGKLALESYKMGYQLPNFTERERHTDTDKQTETLTQTQTHRDTCTSTATYTLTFTDTQAQAL